MTDTLFDIKALIESNKILRGKLKERMSEMEKELNTKHLSSPRIIKMKIEKSK